MIQYLSEEAPVRIGLLKTFHRTNKLSLHEFQRQYNQVCEEKVVHGEGCDNDGGTAEDEAEELVDEVKSQLPPPAQVRQLLQRYENPKKYLAGGWIDSYMGEFDVYSSTFGQYSREELKHILAVYYERFPSMFKGVQPDHQATIVLLMSFMGNIVDNLANVEAAIQEASWMERNAAGQVERLGTELQDVEVQLAAIEQEVASRQRAMGPLYRAAWPTSSGAAGLIPPVAMAAKSGDLGGGRRPSNGSVSEVRAASVQLDSSMRGARGVSAHQDRSARGMSVHQDGSLRGARVAPALSGGPPPRQGGSARSARGAPAFPDVPSRVAKDGSGHAGCVTSGQTRDSRGVEGGARGAPLAVPSRKPQGSTPGPKAMLAGAGGALRQAGQKSQRKEGQVGAEGTSQQGALGAGGVGGAPQQERRQPYSQSTPKAGKQSRPTGVQQGALAAKQYELQHGAQGAQQSRQQTTLLSNQHAQPLGGQHDSQQAMLVGQAQAQQGAQASVLQPSQSGVQPGRQENTAEGAHVAKAEASVGALPAAQPKAQPSQNASHQGEQVAPPPSQQRGDARSAQPSQPLPAQQHKLQHKESGQASQRVPQQGMGPTQQSAQQGSARPVHPGPTPARQASRAATSMPKAPQGARQVTLLSTAKDAQGGRHGQQAKQQQGANPGWHLGGLAATNQAGRWHGDKLARWPQNTVGEAAAGHPVTKVLGSAKAPPSGLHVVHGVEYCGERGVGPAQAGDSSVPACVAQASGGGRKAGATTAGGEQQRVGGGESSRAGALGDTPLPRGVGLKPANLEHVGAGAPPSGGVVLQGGLKEASKPPHTKPVPIELPPHIAKRAKNDSVCGSARQGTGQLQQQRAQKWEAARPTVVEHNSSLGKKRPWQEPGAAGNSHGPQQLPRGEGLLPSEDDGLANMSKKARQEAAGPGGRQGSFLTDWQQPQTPYHPRNDAVLRPPEAPRSQRQGPAEGAASLKALTAENIGGQNQPQRSDAVEPVLLQGQQQRLPAPVSESDVDMSNGVQIIQRQAWPTQGGEHQRPGGVVPVSSQGLPAHQPHARLPVGGAASSQGQQSQSLQQRGEMRLPLSTTSSQGQQVVPPRGEAQKQHGAAEPGQRATSARDLPPHLVVADIPRPPASNFGGAGDGGQPPSRQ